MQRQLFAAAINPIPDYYDEEAKYLGHSCHTVPPLYTCYYCHTAPSSHYHSQHHLHHHRSRHHIPRHSISNLMSSGNRSSQVQEAVPCTTLSKIPTCVRSFCCNSSLIIIWIVFSIFVCQTIPRRHLNNNGSIRRQEYSRMGLLWIVFAISPQHKVSTIHLLYKC